MSSSLITVSLVCVVSLAVIYGILIYVLCNQMISVIKKTNEQVNPDVYSEVKQAISVSPNAVSSEPVTTPRMSSIIKRKKVDPITEIVGEEPKEDPWLTS